MSTFDRSVLDLDPASCAFLVELIATVSTVELSTGVVPWLFEGLNATFWTCAFQSSRCGVWFISGAVVCYDYFLTLRAVTSVKASAPTVGR